MIQHRLVALLTIVGIVILGLRASAQSGLPEPYTPSMAIERLAVLPMAADRSVVPNATVIIDDGRIAAVGPSEEVPVPEDARREADIRYVQRQATTGGH